MKPGPTLVLRARRRAPSFGSLWLLLALALASHPASATEEPEKLLIFGHLTQAYGESDRGSIQGATEGGTTDLSKIAVQFRWEKTERDVVVVQLAHERRGDDIFFPKGDEVEIDWAFYERRLGAHSWVKIGRLNVPLGVYNEIRDVGTLLPFFNLPISFYAGVLSSAETVDGISLGRTFAPRSEWSVEAELYYGGWDTFQQQISAQSKFGLVNLEARAEDGIGVQLWLDTPIEGLRVGAGTLTWLLDGPLTPPGVLDRWDTHHVSVDLTGERWLFRLEHRRWSFEQDFGGFLGQPISLRGKAERRGFYVQLGNWLTRRVGLFGQFEETALEDNLGLFPDLDDFHEERALSLNYRLKPDLLVKLEYHKATTRFPLGEPELPVEAGADPADVEWMMVGLSVSF